MHVRMNSITGATDIDGGVRFIRDEVIPVLQQQTGYRGLTMSADRETATVGVLTMWETEADMKASESAAGKVRQEAVAVTGGEVAVRAFELAVDAIGDPPPSEGCSLRIRRMKMDPSRVDDNLAYFESEILPPMKAAPGFRAVRNMIDRTTGEATVGTVWADEASMQAADDRFASRRDEVAGRGIEFGETSTRVILLTQTA